MAEQNPQEPINGIDRYRIEKMVGYSITGFADHLRMLSFWKRLLAGENDPEEIAQGLALALCPQRYIPKPKPGHGVSITINIAGDADPQALSGAIKSALASEFSSRR